MGATVRLVLNRTAVVNLNALSRSDPPEVSDLVYFEHVRVFVACLGICVGEPNADRRACRGVPRTCSRYLSRLAQTCDHHRRSRYTHQSGVSSIDYPLEALFERSMRGVVYTRTQRSAGAQKYHFDAKNKSQKIYKVLC